MEYIVSAAIFMPLDIVCNKPFHVAVVWPVKPK